MGFQTGPRGSLTEEHRAKISATKRGRPHSDEHKAAIAAAMRGRVMSEEHKAKITATHLARIARIQEQEAAKEIAEGLVTTV